MAKVITLVQKQPPTAVAHYRPSAVAMYMEYFESTRRREDAELCRSALKLCTVRTVPISDALVKVMESVNASTVMQAIL